MFYQFWYSYILLRPLYHRAAVHVNCTCKLHTSIQVHCVPDPSSELVTGAGRPGTAGRLRQAKWVDAAGELVRPQQAGHADSRLQ